MDGQAASPWNRLGPWGTSLLTLLPAVTAFFLTCRIPVGAAVSGDTARPPLAFAQYAVNLREVEAKPLIDARFDFWNRGDEPLTITQLDPSCGCLTPTLERNQKTFAPGERGSFAVFVRTANESPGPKEYTILARYESGGEEFAQYLTFRLTVPRLKLSIEPQQLIFYEFAKRPEPLKVYVSDYRGTPIQVLDATTPSDLFTVTVLDREVDNQGQIRVPILVEVTGEIPAGRKMERMTIKTSDPEFNTLQVPITVFGRPGKERLAEGQPNAKSAVVPASGAFYSRGDVQYFPPGALPSSKEAKAEIERYNAERAAEQPAQPSQEEP
jgi:hypothetical protein